MFCKSHRPIIGIEALRLQGMFFEDRDLNLYTNEFLHNLAGNAFSATTVMTPLAALFLLLARVHTRDIVDAL
jgi:hypothetical protein